MSLKRCTKCVTPETQETITFNDSGSCSICTQVEYKSEVLDWDEQKKKLDELIGQYKGKHQYDCIIPFSGGKDSTWTLYYLMKEYGLRPLVVRFNHGFMREKLSKNTERTLRELGADFHDFQPNWKVVQKTMLQALLEKGDFCWHCHTGIFAYPMWVAIQQKVPLIIWGEPSAEYTSYYSYDQEESVDETRFNRINNMGITAEDMNLRLGYIFDERELRPFTYPPLDELKAINYRSVCLGSYIPWDVKMQSKIIADELGWEGDEVENVPEQYGYEKIECYMQGVRDYIKYLKRGFTRPTHLASIDIRNGRMSREDGMKMIEEFEGKKPPSLDLFLDFVGISEEQFYEIVEGHAVSPHTFDLSKIIDGKKTHDFNDWDRSGKQDKEVAAEIVDRWKKVNRK